MKPWELYKYQQGLQYNTNTLQYDWCVKISTEEKIIYVFTQCSTSTLDWIVNFLFFWIPQIRPIFCLYGVADGVQFLQRTYNERSPFGYEHSS